MHTACLESWKPLPTHLPSQIALDPLARPLVPSLPLSQILPFLRQSSSPSSIAAPPLVPLCCLQPFHGAAEVSSVSLIPIVPATLGLLCRVHCCCVALGLSMAPLGFQAYEEHTQTGQSMESLPPTSHIPSSNSSVPIKYRSNKHLVIYDRCMYSERKSSNTS